MKRRIAAVGAVVIVGCVVGWIMRPGMPAEPSYGGKALSAWLDDRRATPQGPVVLSDDAVAAVRALGPAALPTLLAWLRQSDSSLSRSAKIVLERRWACPCGFQPTRKARMRAMYGFRALGPAASSAFREIAAIALNSPDEWQRGDAINALTDSDADTMRRLAEGLKSPEPEVRLRAVNALTCIRIAPDEVCLPASKGPQTTWTPGSERTPPRGLRSSTSSSRPSWAVSPIMTPRFERPPLRLSGATGSRSGLPARSPSRSS